MAEIGGCEEGTCVQDMRVGEDASDGRKASKWIAIALIVLGLLFLAFWGMILIEADEFVPIPFWVGMISLLLGAAAAIYYKRLKRSA